MQTTALATNNRVAEILCHANLVPPKFLEGLNHHAGKQQVWIGQLAVENGFLTYDELARVIATTTNFPLVNIRGLVPEQRALERLPATECRRHGVAPFAMQQEKLLLAMANPLDDASLMLLREAARCELVIHVAPLDVILQVVEEWFTASSTPHSVSVREELKPLSSEVLSTAHTESCVVVTVNSAGQSGLHDLLRMMKEQSASDLHLAAGSPPKMRVHGSLRLMPFPILTSQGIQTLVTSILSESQRTKFAHSKELDFSYYMPGFSRFRVNLHRQCGSVGAVFRRIPIEVPTLEQLQLPPVVRDFTLKPRGLVLVTGPTGSGKSTTLAAMVDEINRTAPVHIITIEDPIEFLHTEQMSIVTQREIGQDTDSFSIALRHLLRQDPDVILIGELRDLETIAAALTAAETGHLVFATMHTTSAAQTIDRIIDVFPETQQQQVRTQVANVLEGILTQTLVLRLDGKGRVCALEVLVATPAIRNLIRENKIHQIPGIIQAGAKYGMQLLDSALSNLVLTKQISREEALRRAHDTEELNALMAIHKSP